MIHKMSNLNKKKRGQSMVEFALTLPVVLTLVFGIIEFGFLLWSYSSVNSAAREAARYGIAIGTGSSGGSRYYDCVGIRNAALRVGAFAGMQASDVLIHYDNGALPDVYSASPNPNYAIKYNTCEQLSALGGNDTIEFGDRIVIAVTHDYQPIASMIGFNIQPFNMIARANRTIVKSAEVVTSGSGTGGTGAGTVCFTLTTTHTGDGGDPSVSPSSSSGCNLTEYKGGETLTFTAAPDVGWSVAGWVGTDNDASTSITNTVSMPGGHHTVSVTYVNATATCYTLGLTADGTGTGSGPTATPANSTGCSGGEYVSGELIYLDATANVDSGIVAWSGTNNDVSTADTNLLTMPGAAHSVNVTFDLLSTTCYALTVGQTGSGTGLDPAPSASNCAGGLYIENTVVTLNALADAGSEVAGWTGSNNDASTSTSNTTTMDADKTVEVVYEVTTAPDPPLNVDIPHSAGDWKWQNGQKQCQMLDLDWSVNGSWAPHSPVYYEVFNSGTSWGSVGTSTYWDANVTVNQNSQAKLGVRAVFAGGVVSDIDYVIYTCLSNQLVLWGHVIE